MTAADRAASRESHDLSSGREARRRRLRAALALTAAVLALEIGGGIASGSLALLADAAHLFADIAALILAYAAITVAGRAPTGRHTFGLYRAEILAAFVNAQVLLVLAVGILVEAALRFSSPVAVRTGVMLWIAAVALVANLAAMRLLSPGRTRDRGRNLNMRAAYLEVFTDMIGSAAVLAAAIAIPRTGWLWLDPAVSVAVAVFILPRAASLLKQSAHILLEGSPGDIDSAAVREELLGVPGIEAIHDLHFWTLTSGLHSASVHIRAGSDSPRRDLLQAVQGVLKRAAGVDHATIQVEWGSEMTCHSSSR
ncbi:MAG TPA: cation diffusion facilitator family transporter, partial [Thermoanaerobaculia bacterium]|nr:cation diffusion facilitator family transporter [Thermoanaerobaculia bacterium]